LVADAVDRGLHARAYALHAKLAFLSARTSAANIADANAARTLVIFAARFTWSGSQIACVDDAAIEDSSVDESSVEDSSVDESSVDDAAIEESSVD